MPEAVKEGGGTADVATPEEKVPPSVDLATDGAVEVKPPPSTEPSLPIGEIKQQQQQLQQQQQQPPQQQQQQEKECGGEADVEMGEVAPEIKEPPTEQGSGNDGSTIRNEPTEKEGVDAAVPVEEKVAERSPDEELQEMILTGSGLLKYKRDCYAAAEVLSKACETASKIHGDLSDNCAELYYLYGCAMLECGKSENNILGENLKDKNVDGEEEVGEGEEEGSGEEEDDSEEKGAGDDESSKEVKEGDEAMEVDENQESGTPSEVAVASNGTVKEDTKDNSTKPNEEAIDSEDDDSSLKVAWEMFEMAKVVYSRLEETEKLADTFMKLGEVGIESGHPSAMDEMLKALEIRQRLFPKQRIIPETHFNIGLGYSMYEMFSEAISHFEQSKTLLQEIITNLETIGDESSLKEAKEIKEILPDLQEKIQDMLDSKQEKRKEVEEKLKNGLPLSSPKENGTAVAGTSEQNDTNKPATNITHLIKRKRKIEEVTSDLPGKALEESRRKVKALDKETLDSDKNDEDKENQNSIDEEVKESSNQVDTSEVKEEIMEIEENDAKDIKPQDTSNAVEQQIVEEKTCEEKETMEIQEVNKETAPSLPKEEDTPSSVNSSDKTPLDNVISNDSNNSTQLDDNKKEEIPDTNKIELVEKTVEAVDKTCKPEEDIQKKSSPIKELNEKTESKEIIVTDSGNEDKVIKADDEMAMEVVEKKGSDLNIKNAEEKEIVVAEDNISNKAEDNVELESEKKEKEEIDNVVEDKLTTTSIEGDKKETPDIIVTEHSDKVINKEEPINSNNIIKTDDDKIEEEKEKITTNGCKEGETTEEEAQKEETPIKDLPKEESTSSSESTAAPPTASPTPATVAAE